MLALPRSYIFPYHDDAAMNFLILNNRIIISVKTINFNYLYIDVEALNRICICFEFYFLVDSLKMSIFALEKN